jgi:outer membrane protein TolC
MQKIFSSLLVIVLLVQGINAQAQQKLTLNEAIQTALKNNLSIQLAKDSLAISKLFNDYGYAGGLPSITTTVNENKTSSSIQQLYTDPTRNTIKTGVAGTTVNGSLAASVVLFNGYHIVATKDRLNALEKQDQVQLQSRINNVVSAVMQQYYNIIHQQDFLKTIQLSIEASKERVNIVNMKAAVGVANNTDLFQSSLDLNALQQGALNQQLIIDQAKADLLNYLTLPTSTQYVLVDTIKVDPTIKLASIESSLKNNPDLLSANQTIAINQYLEKEVRASMIPTLRATTGYTYSSNKSDAGFSLLSETYGPYVGVNLSIPLYAGGINKKNYKAAKIGTDIAKTQYTSLEYSLNTAAYKTYISYLNSIQQSSTEQSNYAMAKELLELVMSKFKIGQATIVDVKQAQQSFETAGFRLTSLTFAAKSAEVELKRLSNQLTF